MNKEIEELRKQINLQNEELQKQSDRITIMGARIQVLFSFLENIVNRQRIKFESGGIHSDRAVNEFEVPEQVINFQNRDVSEELQGYVRSPPNTFPLDELYNKMKNKGGNAV